jgi:PAS domain S-box-containing protein
MNFHNYETINQPGFLTKSGFEEMLNHLPVAIYYCDNDGNIIFCNDKAIEIWGRKPNTGDSIEKFCGSYKIYNLDGSFLPNDQCPMAKAILGRLPAMNGEIIIERPDGSWVYAKANIKAIRDERGNVVGAINTLLDVSAEFELTEAKRITDENFRFLADFIPQMVWIAKPNGDVEYYNKNWLAYSKLTLQELKNMGWMQLVHPEEYGLILNEWQHSLKSCSQFNVITRLKSGSDEYRWFLTRATPMKNSHGSIVRWFGSCTDIHDQKETENDLVKSQVNLETLNQELQKINNQLDSFIYTASHDLKAPIANIEGLTNHLLKSLNVNNFDDAKVKSIIGLIYASINKFKSTIGDLTEITKIQRDLQNNETKSIVNLKEIVDEVIHDISGLIHHNQATIMTDFAKCDSIVFSRANLKSILYNLISNGIKYRSAERAPVVSIVTNKIEDEFIITVSDNGLGFKSEIKDKLFTLFKRFHSHVEGNGMGLYIVKRIVDNANGNIEVESDEGVGTVFRISLKLDSENQ